MYGLIASCFFALGCGSDPLDPPAVADVPDAEVSAPDVLPAAGPVVAIPGNAVGMRFQASDFYAAPFPSDHRNGATGFPNPHSVQLVDRIAALVGDEVGFGTTSGIFFTLDDTPGPLPGLHASVQDDSPVFLVSIDPSALDYGTRYPITLNFQEDGGPFGAKRLLTLLPLQGVPLRPSTTYAAVILRSLGDAKGEPLGVSLPMVTLARGEAPVGLGEPALGRYLDALANLEILGADRHAISGLAVFTTGDPHAGLSQLVDTVRALPTPKLDAPVSAKEVFDDFCVFEGTVPMPIYQAGEPPFTSEGGGWTFDAAGQPIAQGTETARIVVTIPRTPMPPQGFPTAVFIRTGGGGDRPLVDRGRRAEPGGGAIEPGTGPALYFARAGWAGVSVDGPHGGLRNITQDDEQFLMFNVTNPAALRDNVRQSALELVLLADILDTLSISAGSCDGAGDAELVLDASGMTLMGHSMGATIAPAVLAFEPRYRASILSGSGGSWIENLVHKQSPIEVKPFAEAILGYPGLGREIHPHDPVLSLLQWAGEAADSAVYGPLIIDRPRVGKPRHVLMLQGIVDTYILPPIANATPLSIGLDLAGPSLDKDHPDLASYATLASVLPLVGRQQQSLPAIQNRDPATAIVVQHAEDGVEDGHEVAFQTEAAKHQYRCFLESLLKGAPRVPVAAPSAFDPCE